jgi:hypothetical protein
MVDVKITALPSAVSAADADLVPIVQGGVTKQSSVGAIRSGLAVTAAPAAAVSTHVAAVDPHADRAFATSAVSTHAGAVDPHGDRSFATSAVSTHAGAVDPHGDRAFATSADTSSMSAHNGASDPHADRSFATSAISTHAGAADPHADRAFATTAVSNHAGAVDPHGDRSFATTSISTHAGAADPHGDRAAATSAISTHAGAVDPHGDRAFATAADTTSMSAHNAASDPHADRSFATTAVSNHAAAVDPHGDRSFTTTSITTHAGAADPHADRAFATSSITTHAGAADPHGDRAFATAADTALGPRLLAGLDVDSRVFRSRLSNHATAFLMVSGTSYFVYVGRTTAAITPKFVELHVATIGAGAQTAELGLFSTPLGPNKAAQSLTKLVSTATIGALTSLGMVRNTSAFAASVPAGTHLWAGVRTAMATTQPSPVALAYDMAQGSVLSAAASGVLTGAGPFSGAIIAASTAQICPDLRVTMD